LDKHLPFVERAMSLSGYYRTLGLRTGASFTDVKAAYRKLARKYHPDANPDNQRAKDRFIAITQAYSELSDVLQLEASLKASQANDELDLDDAPEDDSDDLDEAVVAYESPPSPVRQNLSLSALEQQLKQTAYEQLQDLLKKQKYPRAVALVEGLAQRITQDPEVRQWQAITYQRWARHLIGESNFIKAKVYLNKALKTDPLNKSLWVEVNRDFRQMEEQMVVKERGLNRV
jgi:curved DNA-binding protein CbpA